MPAPPPESEPAIVSTIWVTFSSAMPSNLASLIRNLQQRKGRRRQRLAVAEGVRLVEEALAAGVPFRGALHGASFGGSGREAQLLRDLAAHAASVEEVSDRTLDQLADTDTPQGILAVIEPPAWLLSAIHPAAGAPVVVLDGVQDPGNVGTLLRTAFALGAGGGVPLRGTADLNPPKVMRAGAGATFRLPTAAAGEEELRGWLEQERPVVWAAATEGTPVERLTPPERLVLIVGNEGAGIRPQIGSLAQARGANPPARRAELPQVPVAAGVL